MAYKWDSIVKQLVHLHPDHFACWLLPQLLAFVHTIKVVGEANVELKAQHLFADALLKVRVNGKLGLLHIEVQLKRDPKMGKRVMEYNVLAEHQHQLKVVTVVIYLRKCQIPEPPYEREALDGGPGHLFHYRVIKLWELTAESIVELGWDGLLPFLPLTIGGKKPEIVQVMIDRLSGDKELLALAEMFGGLAFTRPQEKEQFERRFDVFQEILEESWVYQRVKNNYKQQGLEEGRQQGRQEGVGIARQKQYQTIMQIIGQRFPSLEVLALQQVKKLTDLDALNVLLVEIASAREAEEVRQLLEGIDLRK